jgi:hypothetical protein
MTVVAFRPWEGRKFPKTKILILGESAYDWDDGGKIRKPSPNLPTDNVRWTFDHFDQDNSRYLIQITRAICGKKQPNRREREAAWSEYAYSIYVPGSIGQGARTARPSAEMWRTAKRFFPSLLNELEPEKIIVTGYDMWKDGMPDCEVFWVRDIQAYRLSNGRLAWCMAQPHPSNSKEGFSWEAIANRIAFFRSIKFPRW